MTDFEPRVVLQLLDFLYRYVSETLQDADVRFIACFSAKIVTLRMREALGTLAKTDVCKSSLNHSQRQVLQAYSERASKARREITPEDILLAIQSRESFSFVQPPPQDVRACLRPTSCCLSTFTRKLLQQVQQLARAAACYWPRPSTDSA